MHIKKQYIYLQILILILGIIFISCRAEDSDFPIPSAHQGFDFSLSRDSIIMDTIPSEYLSATYNIRLYNPSKRAITLKSIKLLDTEKGFSINVDGSFGQSFEEVELRERDSIYIFAKAFLPIGQEDEPTKVEDILEIVDNKGRVLNVPIIAIRQNVEHIKSLVIEQDLTRATQRPWLVRDSIIVEQGAKLKMKSPAQIWFQDNAYMRVKGELEIEGRAEQAVRFCSTRWDKFLPLVPYSHLTGQWGGVFFDEGAKAKLAYLHLVNASFGLHFAPNKGADEQHPITIKHCRVHNIKGAGINADLGYFKVSDSEISNTLGSCLVLSGGRYDIERSSIINYYPWPDIRTDEALIYQDQSQDKALINQANPASFLHIKHSIIDGEMPVYTRQREQRGGEVKLSILRDKATEAPIRFSHCYLRSIQFPNNQYYQFQNILYRARKTKTEELYQYLGEDKDKKKDYRFDFRPKATAPFIGLGLDGSSFSDLDGKVREPKMTYGAYRAK